ncbi:MAG: hypothetical protein QXG99_02775 [Conexivisphaerales archaeon]
MSLLDPHLLAQPLLEDGALLDFILPWKLGAIINISSYILYYEGNKRYNATIVSRPEWASLSYGE